MGRLTVVGLGPGPPELVTLEVAMRLREASQDGGVRVYAFSSVVPTLERIAPALTVTVLDPLIEQAGADRATAFGTIISQLVEDAFRYDHDVIYAVTGNPLVVNDLVLLLRRTCQRYGKPIEVLSGLSFFDRVLDRLYWRGDPGVQLLSAWALAREQVDLNPGVPALLFELGEALGPDAGGNTETETLLAALKERLLAYFPGEHRLALLYTEGAPDFASESRAFALDELDEQTVTPLSNLWVPAISGPESETELAP